VLTITYGQSSVACNRGQHRSSVPLQAAADPPEAGPRPRGLVDKTFAARGENSRLKEELVKTRELAVGGQVALQENESSEACSSSTAGRRSPAPRTSR